VPLRSDGRPTHSCARTRPTQRRTSVDRQAHALEVSVVDGRRRRVRRQVTERAAARSSGQFTSDGGAEQRDPARREAGRRPGGVSSTTSRLARGSASRLWVCSAMGLTKKVGPSLVVEAVSERPNRTACPPAEGDDWVGQRPAWSGATSVRARSAWVGSGGAGWGRGVASRSGSAGSTRG